MDKNYSHILKRRHVVLFFDPPSLIVLLSRKVNKVQQSNCRWDLIQNYSSMISVTVKYDCRCRSSVWCWRSSISTSDTINSNRSTASILTCRITNFRIIFDQGSNVLLSDQCSDRIRCLQETSRFWAPSSHAYWTPTSNPRAAVKHTC